MNRGPESAWQEATHAAHQGGHWSQRASIQVNANASAKSTDRADSPQPPRSGVAQHAFVVGDAVLTGLAGLAGLAMSERATVTKARTLTDARGNRAAETAILDGPIGSTG